MNIISGLNECATLFQWLTSAISSLHSQWNGTEKHKLEGDVLQLQSDLQCLGDTLPAMYNLIDRAEWRIHDHCVADLLSKLKDAVYDAEDLLDEFTWHGLKVSIEGNATQLAPFIDFIGIVTKGRFNKVIDIQKRLNNLSNQLKGMGFHQSTPRFDESLRPETTCFPTEAMVFGRDKDMNELIRLLGVPLKSNNKRTSSEVVAPTSNRRYPSRSKTARTGDGSSTSSQVYTTLDNSEETMTSVPVLPIVGIGGVGKTTLAQQICSHREVKSRYGLIIWICVSDDFDVKRLTKEALEQASRKAPMKDNLKSLQDDLVDSLNKRRFLMVLDDMWNENEECWKRFYAPLKNVLKGSMMLVTTRSEKVADIVGTMDSFPLQGLKDDVYWKFFKLCAFGSDSSNRDSELERIGKEISKKLGGSPLAAKTIGRLLGISRDTTQWNNILTSELWELDQEGTEILPALRLSYMYLPFHLKKCFSFCAVYPKDHKFEKVSLAEMWAAEGFVVPKGNIPLQEIGSQYFEDLVNRSFFQKLRGAYVIHDLMHDMAQLVSKDECFIIKNSSDIDKVPQNVRHLSILPIINVKCSDLSSLGKCTKLRTLLCNKPLSSDILSSAMDHWFTELWCLRVIFCVSTKKLPENIGNLKHLRYLEISRTIPLMSLPSSFCSLYNLQFFYAKKCNVAKLPRGIDKLINLQKFESYGPKINVDAAEGEGQIRFIKNFFKDKTDLAIYNLGAISKDRAAEMELSKNKFLNSLTLRWYSLRSAEHNEIEVLQALQPPTSIKSVHLNGYPGEYLPSWFRGRDEPEHIPFPNLPAVTIDNNNGRVGTILRSLTKVSLTGCPKLLSLEQFLQPAYMPFLEELRVSDCPMVNSQRLLVPSLKKLTLENSGNLGDNIDCSSLTVLHLSEFTLAFIELQKWRLPLLQELMIYNCGSLTFIRESEHLSLGLSRARHSTRKFPSLTHLTIRYCENLESLEDLLTHEYLPTIESITIESCGALSWQSGTVFPPSLNKLCLSACGDFSAWSPSCLENLCSLKSLVMQRCHGIVSIPGDLWRGSLRSLQCLKIEACPDLVSIGGPEAIANINALRIADCPKLNEIEQSRGNYWS